MTATPAVEGGQRCQACGLTDLPHAPIPMQMIRLDERESVWVCIDVVACRKSAELLGRYGRVPERRAA